MAKIEVNKISKIYQQCSKNLKTFKNVDQAKSFFLTKEALDTFNKYCLKQEWRLTSNNQALHWTISFELDTDPKEPYIPPSDLWQEQKQFLHDQDIKDPYGKESWFVRPNYPLIIHNAEQLF